MTSITLRLSETGLTVTGQQSGQGAPVVLLHGVGLQSAAWAPQMTALARHAQLIALDLPGHGGSDPLPVGSGLSDFVDWCAAALAALDLGPVSLAGHSMGALIAGGIAVDYPHHTERVALLNGVSRRSASARAAVEARAAAIRAGQIDHDAPLMRWFADAQSTVRADVSGWLHAVDAQGYATAYTAFATGDDTYADDLHRIRCPFLAVTGTEDINSTPAMSQAMAMAVQNGASHVIQGHGHMMNLTAPDQTTAQLAAWLKSPVLAKAAS